MICVIHNSSEQLFLQIEIIDNKLIVGNDDVLTIINLATKERKEFPVFPIFHEFIVCCDRIVVVGELEVFCLLEDSIVWEIEFDDIIDIKSMEDNKLILSTFETQKEIIVDIITGQRSE